MELPCMSSPSLPSPASQLSKAFYFFPLLCWLMKTVTVPMKGKGAQLPFRAIAVVMGLPVVT